MIQIKYKLYREVDSLLSARQQVLLNRGIPVEEQEPWLKASQKDINDWQLLDNIEDAVNKIISALKNKQKTIVLQDCD